MKLVDFVNIQSGIRKLAAVKETLEHMQEAYKEALNSLTQGIIAQGAGVTVLYGCVNSGTLPVYNITAGAVFYAGEIYEVPAFAGTAGGADVPVLSLNTTYRAGDPALYKKADGTTETINTHSIKKLLWSFAPSGSGIADFSATVTIKSRVATLLTGEFQPVGSYAPLNSPALTGLPTAPTAATPTNTTQIATTAFVQAVVAALVDSSPGTLDTLNELAAALGDDPNFATTITNALAGKASIAQLNARAYGGLMSLGPDDFDGTTYSVDQGSSASPVGWPLLNQVFQLVTTVSRQVAVQLDGAGAGDLYYRVRSGTWGAWTKLNIGHRIKIVEIGDWNMDTDISKFVAHGLGADWKKVRRVNAIIRNDLDDNYNPLDRGDIDGAGNHSGKVAGSVWQVNSGDVKLYRVDAASMNANSTYDSTSYDSTSYNRGWVIIEYDD